MSDYFNPVRNLIEPQVSALILKGRQFIRIEEAGSNQVELSLTGARKLRDWLNTAVPDERDADQPGERPDGK